MRKVQCQCSLHLLCCFRFLCCVAMAIDWTHKTGKPQEFCTMEFFNASCPHGHVIVMQSALYGRMRLGRCVQQDFGHLGCSKNVLNQLDIRCSGRSSCQIQLPDPILFRLLPCPGDLSSYLEASYFCLEVDTGSPEMCANQVRPLGLDRGHGYIGSPADDSSIYGSSKCPWVLYAKPGQHFNITLYNFMGTESGATGVDSYGPPRADVCLEVAAVYDLGVNERRGVTVCGGDARRVHLMVTQTNRLKIELNQRIISSMGAFIIEYQVVGCADPSLFVDGWLRRNGDTALLGCNSSLTSWHLTCKNGQWHGEQGNCSTSSGGVWRFDQMFSKEESFPYGVLLMVVVGVAVGVVIGGLLLCLIVTCTKRLGQSPELNGYSASEYQGIVINPTAMSHHGAIGQTTTTTVYSDWMGGEPAVDDPTLLCDHRSPAPSLRAFDVTRHPGSLTHHYPMPHHHHHRHLHHSNNDDVDGTCGALYSLHTSPKQQQQQQPFAPAYAGCYSPSTPLANFRHLQLQQQQPTQFVCQDSQDFV